MRLYLTISGSGEMRDVAKVPSFEAATEYVRATDKRCDDWLHDRIQDPPDEDFLWYWEGCDVYLEDDTGNVFFFDDKWRPLNATA